MSFSVIRKYERPLLLVISVFAVLAFAFFPIFGSVADLFTEGGPRQLAGAFTVAPTGERREVTADEFLRARRNLGKLFETIEDDVVWAHLMKVADARAAGMEVTDADLLPLVDQISGGSVKTQEDYKAFWRYLRFTSGKAFEEFLGDLLVADRWTEALRRAAAIVDADEIYQRWRVDNELFDLEAIVFPDREPEDVPDPGPEVLRSWWDGMDDWRRERLFVDPARHDVVAGWLPLDVEPSSLPADVLEGLDEPTDVEIETRFRQVKADRWPDLDEPDDEARAILADELTVIALAEEAYQVFSGSADETEGPTPEAPPSRDDFVVAMESFGLRVVDPEGLMGPEELEALPDIGSARLPLQLSRTTAGDVRFYRPFGDVDVVSVLYVEAVEEARPLSFEEAGDQVLEAWRTEPEQTGRAARAFREELRERTRALPEAAEVIEPLEEEARGEAEAALAELDGEPTEDERAAALEEAMDAVETDIHARLAEYEHLVWDETVEDTLAEVPEARRITLEDVSKGYRRRLDGEEEKDSLERFLKTNAAVFRQDEDTVTDVLRHVQGSQSVVVRVTERSFPEKAAMLDDEDGFEAARRSLMSMRMAEFAGAYTPERLLQPRSEENPYGHGLQVVRREEEVD